MPDPSDPASDAADNPADDPADDRAASGPAMDADGVRRELARARLDEPLPEDVAARLDRVLAGLAAEQTEAVLGASADPAADPDSGSPRIADVVDLAATRRRRATSLLVAAAAAVVLAAGIGHVLGANHGANHGADHAADSASATSATADKPRDATAGGALAPSASTPARAATVLPTPVPSTVSPDLSGAGLRHAALRTYPLTAAHFTRDVRGLLARRMSSPHGNDTALNDSLSASASRGASCRLRDPGPGTLLPVTYDGTPAVLALRPATGQTRVVDLLACGSGEVVRSVSVPVHG